VFIAKQQGKRKSTIEENLNIITINAMQCEEKTFALILHPLKIWFIVKVIFLFLFSVSFPLKQPASFGSSICVQSYNAQIYQFFLYIFESEFLNLLVKCV